MSDTSPIKTLISICYSPDRRTSDAEIVASPSWNAIREAISRMDDDGFPIVVLSTQECTSTDEAFEDDDSLHLIGGNERFALFQCSGPWRYRNPKGSDAEVRLWQSDQGYFCTEANLANLDLALHIAKAFYETANFDVAESVSQEST